MVFGDCKVYRVMWALKALRELPGLRDRREFAARLDRRESGERMVPKGRRAQMEKRF